MLWEKKREKRALCLVERFDAPQRPDKPAPKEWDHLDLTVIEFRP